VDVFIQADVFDGIPINTNAAAKPAPERTSSEAACLATSAVCRCGLIIISVEKPIVVVQRRIKRASDIKEIADRAQARSVTRPVPP
jgi:hypothetical protein